ncbi:MAG: ssb [Oerskovia sp.]|nr:ssb [Oerskovia sp.]
MGNDVTVTLAGFMGTTPKLFTSPTGNDFTSFRIASTTRYLDRSRGEWVDGRTIWFTVKAWRAMAQNVAASLRKGDAVVVTGRRRGRPGARLARCGSRLGEPGVR